MTIMCFIWHVNCYNVLDLIGTSTNKLEKYFSNLFLYVSTSHLHFPIDTSIFLIYSIWESSRSSNMLKNHSVSKIVLTVGQDITTVLTFPYSSSSNLKQLKYFGPQPRIYKSFSWSLDFFFSQ